MFGSRCRVALSIIGLTLVVCLTVRPTLNAGNAGDLTALVNHGSASEAQFLLATDLTRPLHDHQSESSGVQGYRHAIDAYEQVARIGDDPQLCAQSLARAAELTREMADLSGDSSLYQESIERYRKLIIEYPDSNLIGGALTSVAEMYEENLQDLDGAAGAYSELARRFPSSVISREALAVLNRLEYELQRRSSMSDVLVASTTAMDEGVNEALGRARLSNIRNFSGRDYARVVIDISGSTAYTQNRTSPDRITVHLEAAYLPRSLDGRRFMISDGTLLKRITVVGSPLGSGLDVQLNVGKIGDFSVFEVSEPQRIIIDLHSESASESIALTRAGAESGGPAPLVRRPSSTISGNAILSLPEIGEPIVPRGEGINSTVSETGVPGNDLKTGVKCIVIDPGHGGHDTGTIGAGGLREKDLVLDVARRLRAYIKSQFPDVEVILTRDSDRFIALEERTAIANSRRADLFISVHANASPSRGASGVETFFVNPQRAKNLMPNPPMTAAQPIQSKTQDAGISDAIAGNDAGAARSSANSIEPMVASVSVGNRIAASRELARYIQSGLVRGVGAASPRTAVNRGVKHASFAVLIGSTMPSVLAEVSFVSNRRDESLLQTSGFRDRIAASLFAGLKAYLKKGHQSDQAKKK